jgi:hypothetical protein
MLDAVTEEKVKLPAPAVGVVGLNKILVLDAGTVAKVVVSVLLKVPVLATV